MIPRYRAFYKANQKMYEVLTLDIIDEKVLIENNDNPKSPLRGYVKITETELMQSTGLKDKNGKEIYEGDVVLCDRNINDAFDKTTFLIGIDEYFRYQGVSKLGNEISVEEFECAEVIGNIYENQELLEVGR